MRNAYVVQSSAIIMPLLLFFEEQCILYIEAAVYTTAELLRIKLIINRIQFDFGGYNEKL